MEQNKRQPDFQGQNTDGERKRGNKGGKAAKAAKAAVFALMAGCLAGSLGLNIYQAREAASQNAKVNKFIDGQLERQAKEEEQENTYLEDGYLVGEEYEIRSTKNISDAYLSGDESGLSKEDKETLKMATDVLDEVIKDGMDNYEKELAVYSWMYENISQGSGSVVALPGSNAEAYTPYGVLTGHNAVCVGYATTFRMFMNMLEMDCHIVHNEYHSWDLVQLDDKEWYHVDIYSDVAENVEFMNFNMTDDIAGITHEWDASALPAATGLTYTYAVQNSKEIKDIYAVPKKLKRAIEKNNSSLYFSFKEKLTQDELPIADLLVNQVNIALCSVSGYENYTISGNWFVDENGNYILGLYIVNYQDMEGKLEISGNSKVGKAVLEAVEDAFKSLKPKNESDGTTADDEGVTVDSSAASDYYEI